MTSSRRALTVLAVTGLALCLAGSAAAQGLEKSAGFKFDQYAVPTIVAQNEHDALFLQGYIHARDRLFQMDSQRRLFSGQLSELLGPAALAQDVQLRTLGLRRAAERSLPVQTPEVLVWLEAYAEGVNAYLEDASQPLPIEYAALEIDRAGIPPWTVVDSLTMVKGLAFGLSFDLDDIDRTLALLNFIGVGGALGFNGLQLFNNDLYPTAPFDPSISIPATAAAQQPQTEVGAVCPAGVDCGAVIPSALQDAGDEDFPAYFMDPNFKTLVQSYRDAIADVAPLKHALDGDLTARGSNWWIASGAVTGSGFPMLANDPHLALDSPSTFYEVHLTVLGTGGLNVTGVSFPGAPGVVLGCNDTICWGATVNPLDVTDIYNETLLPLDPSQPTTPTHTLFDGVPEPMQFIPQTFLFNAIGDGVANTLVDAMLPPEQGGVTLIVPRRNNGPIAQVLFDPTSPTPLTGLSIQYTGWSGTQELEAFRQFAYATSMEDFKAGLQYFDVGSQNFAYADINGNIAYYTSAELPLREDLQTLFFPAGLTPPYLIRSGTHDSPHEWLPVTNPQPNQSIPYEILPFAEMPQVENPAVGYILNANNDPIGTSLDNVSWNQFRAGFNGLLYLSPGYASGFRMGRIQRVFEAAVAAGPVTLDDYKALQGNNQLLDAEVLTPYLLEAFANATAPGAAPQFAGVAGDTRVAEAIARLGGWDFSTPTGIQAGFDPGDNPLALGAPSAAEIDASVAATIYSAWRGQIVQRVIDGTLGALPVPLTDFAPGSSQAMVALRQFLEDYSTKGGTGASLLNFFTVPGVADPFVARDLVLLGALQSALDLLASDEMAPAFDNSTNQDDYRWGKLHRIVFDSLISSALSIPPAGSPDNLSPDLPGFARSGGFGAVDASSHSARADGLNEFMFGSGPSRRVIATMTPDGPNVLEVIPGGESGVPGSPNQVDQLGLWLVNAYKPLPVSQEDVDASTVAIEFYGCGNDPFDMDGNPDPLCADQGVIDDEDDGEDDGEGDGEWDGAPLDVDVDRDNLGNDGLLNLDRNRNSRGSENTTHEERGPRRSGGQRTTKR